MLSAHLYELLEAPTNTSLTARAVRGGVLLLIFANIVAMVVGSHYGPNEAMTVTLQQFELLSASLFGLEYALRVWAIGAAPNFEKNYGSRTRFALSPMMIIDLLAILPSLIPVFGMLDARVLRLARLFRVGRVFKLGRYSASLQLIVRVFRQKKSDLLSTLMVLSILLFVASTLMYFAEHNAQPKVFPNISESLWWGMGTLTRIGYGTAEPMTVMGRVIGATLALMGVGLFALPTGIITSGYMDELRRRREQDCCPHCGKRL